MLNQLIRFSLSQRAMVLALATALLFLGFKKALDLPVDVLPDLTKPTVTLLTEVPGYAPEEIETLVTVPLENALMGVTGVDRLRSISDVSLSLVFVEFDWDMDIYDARRFVQERLASMTSELPPGIRPHLTPVTSLMGEVMLIGLRDTTGATNPRELRALADWVVSRRLQAIPGIAEIQTMGGGVKQVQVRPNPEKMLRHGVNLEQLRLATAASVKNTTGGFLTEGTQEIMVRNLAMTKDLDAIGDIVVTYRNDRPLRIRDVAEVAWGVEPMRGDAGMGVRGDTHAPGQAPKGYPGVVMSVRKSPGFDTLDLTRQLEQALKELGPSLPTGTEIIPLYKQSDYIDLAVGNLEKALLDGALLVSIVLFLFLLNFRVTLITLTAIPLSLAITALVFELLGVGVNSMTLGGLAVAIGMVVDDAIVDMENIFRRLRENAALSNPESRIKVIADASGEVRSSIFYATLLIVLVFLPLFALSGVEGRLFTPIAIATIVSMTASFLVALTVIPVLCFYLLPDKLCKARAKDSFLTRWVKSAFAATWLRFSLSQPFMVLAIMGGLLWFSYQSFKNMGGNFLPPFQEPSAVVAMTTAPGTSLKTTTELAHVGQDLLLGIPGIKSVGFRAGRAERGDHVVPVSTVEFDIEFDKSAGRKQKEVTEDIGTNMRSIPGTFSSMSGPLADRVGHMLSGVSAKVAVKVFGPDLDELRRLGSQIADIARGIPGLEEARTEQQALVPQLRIELDRKRALAYGVVPGDLNEELATLMAGEKVAEIYEGTRKYDLVLRLPQEWRENPERLKQTYIDTLSGQRIPLERVADIRRATGPNMILRENSQRRFVVSINPTTENLNAAVERLQREVTEKVKLPKGYSISLEGEYQAQREATSTIFYASTILLILVFFLLYGHYRSFALAFLTLGIIPVSLVGAVLYTKYTLDNVSIATLVGFIAVSGIAARNNIMLLTHYLHLMRNEGEGFTRQMIERGTLERLSPILMTALSAGIALVPILLALHEPGREILGPVAIAIVGGLVTSTLLGLAVTPSLFYAFCRKPVESILAKDLNPNT